MIELLEHNVETYQKLCNEMEKHNKAALIQATGTGKSYIISKYIEEHCHNALILVPANAIGDQWQKLLPDVEVKTYQAMAKGIDGEYDLIVADEMHHLGSDVWGQKFIEYFMQNPEQKVIGASATEIRYLDNARDMVKELFDGVAVYGVDITDAINKGILPTFKYISAYYGTEEDYNKYHEKCDKIADKELAKELSRRLELCIQNQISIKEAMTNNLNLENHKIIVFLNGICEIDQAKRMFRDIFPDCECNHVSSKQQSQVNEESIKRYKESEAHISILIAIDMLNEGIHIDDTDCVVMFRNTVSPQLYFQQLGRALSAKNHCKPTIFDFACNSENLKTIESSDGGDMNIISKLNKNISKERKIIIKSYSSELNELFLKLDKFISRKKITGTEAKYILDHQNDKVADIAKNISRSEMFVKKFLASVGVFENEFTDTDELDKKTKELYNKGLSVKKIMLELCINRDDVEKSLARNGICDRLRKEIIMIDPHTETAIKKFSSITEATQYIKENYNPKATYTNISKASRGIKNIIYGFKWARVQ